MIKTLRITGVLAAILAGVLIKYFVLPMVSDVGGDQRVEEVLDSPGVIERFKQTKGTHARGTGNQTSPLVKQAAAYARYLNPPEKPKPRIKGDPRLPRGPVLGPTTPKFQVFATAYFEGDPELSQALIDEPGKGRYWVRQSSMVGHLLIEQVKDGVVVVKSSEETFELEIEKTSKTSLPKGKSPISAGTTGRSSYRRTLPTPGRTVNSSTRTPSGRTPSKTTQNSKPSSSEKADELVRRLQDMKTGLSDEESAARIEKLLSRFKSSTVSAEDAKGLTALGEKLKDNGQDPNITSPASKAGKIEKRPAKPDASTPK